MNTVTVSRGEATVLQNGNSCSTTFVTNPRHPRQKSTGSEAPLEVFFRDSDTLTNLEMDLVLAIWGSINHRNKGRANTALQRPVSLNSPGDRHGAIRLAGPAIVSLSACYRERPTSNQATPSPAGLRKDQRLSASLRT